MRRLTLSILLLIVAAGCAPQTEPRDAGARTWIRDMWTGPSVLPQEETRPLPDGSLTVDGQRLMNRREARLALVNPLHSSPEVVAEGAALYAAYCALCHGEAGAGDGQLADRYRRMPDLTQPYVLNYPDGFVYAVIRDGGRNMPRFADALSVEERWALVHYLRTLEPGEATTRRTPSSRTP